MKNKKWKNKPFISLLTLSGFITMSISGLILILVPQGKIAYWTNWQFLGLSKSQWGDIHITTSLLFLVAGVYHTYYNWRTLLNYIRNKMTKSIALKKELYTSILISIFVIISSVYKLPPLHYILDFNDYLKEEFWVESEEYLPPFGHAEELSLKSFCKKMDIDLGKALGELKRNKIVFSSENQSLEKIAGANSLNAMQIYALIKKFEPKEVYRKFKTAQEVEMKFAGKGFGQKKLGDFCKKMHLDCPELTVKLKKKGIILQKDINLKNNANNNSLTTMDFLKYLLLEDYKKQ